LLLQGARHQAIWGIDLGVAPLGQAGGIVCCFQAALPLPEQLGLLTLQFVYTGRKSNECIRPSVSRPHTGWASASFHG
jgi:hypothetical protein